MHNMYFKKEKNEYSFERGFQSCAGRRGEEGQSVDTFYGDAMAWEVDQQ